MSSRRLLTLVVLALIGSSASAGPRRLSDSSYYDKVRGAWLGKCIGGALGMPIESWNYRDIEAKYPQIDGYLGYFPESTWKGWSGMLGSTSVPKDGKWYRLYLKAQVPAYNTVDLFAVPIVGMSFEYSREPACLEVTSLRLLRPASNLSFSSADWETASSCAWTQEGTAKLDFTGERAWLKVKPSHARKMSLEPDDGLLLACEARWISGDNRIGLALDYYSPEGARGFGPDDDTTYQIIGLHTLETCGPDMSCKDIGKEWCRRLPPISSWLAEGLALERMKKGILPPESGGHEIGEAIGGQMRGEIWGLICPGRPELAAEYARRDGVVAHCKNGVYGEQFVAAMISAAFQEQDVRRIIDAGLAAVPADSKYARVVREAIAWCEKYPNWRDARREVVAKYPQICNPVYGEAGIVVLSLLYGRGDFEKSICIAASCGQDTDCNTATVGAILGCIHGARAIPAKWTAPIDDTFRCFATGLETWKISALSRRICTMGRKVQAYHGAGERFSSDL